MRDPRTPKDSRRLLEPVRQAPPADVPARLAELRTQDGLRLLERYRR